MRISLACGSASIGSPCRRSPRGLLPRMHESCAPLRGRARWCRCSADTLVGGASIHKRASAHAGRKRAAPQTSMGGRATLVGRGEVPIAYPAWPSTFPFHSRGPWCLMLLTQESLVPDATQESSKPAPALMAYNKRSRHTSTLL